MSSKKRNELISSLRPRLKELGLMVEDITTAELNNCQRLFDSMDDIAQKRDEAMAILKKYCYTYVSLSKLSGISRQTLSSNELYDTIISSGKETDANGPKSDQQKAEDTNLLDQYKRAYEDCQKQLKGLNDLNVTCAQLKYELETKEKLLKEQMKNVKEKNAEIRELQTRIENAENLLDLMHIPHSS